MSARRRDAARRTTAGESGSLDDFVGAAEQSERHRDAERLGGLEIDDQLHLGGLLHGKIAGLVALENPARINSDQSIRLRLVAAVADEAAGRSKSAVLVDRRNFVTQRKS